MEALQSGSDVLFVLMGAIMVLAMHAGFAFLEVGTVRKKNQVNALVKIIGDFAVSTIAYFFIGYSVAYGVSFFDGAQALSEKNGYELVKFFFLLTFAAAIPAIISGGIAERAKFYPQMMASFVLVGAIYPFFEGITWNGAFGIQDWLEAEFGAGLLHDIGRLVMCLKIPDQFCIAMDFARKSGDRWYKAEAKYFGFDHGGVGGALLRSWNLPKRLQESVAHHHNPSAAKNYGHEAAVIFLADHISHEIVHGQDEEHSRGEINPAAWKRLNLQEATHKSIIKEKVYFQLEEVSQVFLQTT